jgi:hypothetical protein
MPVTCHSIEPKGGRCRGERRRGFGRVVDRTLVEPRMKHRTRCRVRGGAHRAAAGVIGPVTGVALRRLHGSRLGVVLRGATAGRFRRSRRGSRTRGRCDRISQLTAEAQGQSQTRREDEHQQTQRERPEQRRALGSQVRHHHVRRYSPKSGGVNPPSLHFSLRCDARTPLGRFPVAARERARVRPTLNVQGVPFLDHDVAV